MIRFRVPVVSRLCKTALFEQRSSTAATTRVFHASSASLLLAKGDKVRVRVPTHNIESSGI